MIGKYLVCLLVVGTIIGSIYFTKGKNIKKEVSVLSYMQMYGASEIGIRFHEYKEATGEYPAPDILKKILLDNDDNDITLPNGSKLGFSCSGIVPEGYEEQADKFRFKPRYDTRGRIIGGAIYHIGIDGDDDNGDEKNLPEKLKEMDKRILTPWEILFTEDGDLVIYRDIAEYDSLFTNSPFRNLKKKD